MPLLEQVRFCAIYASNLDEFYMVRVAGLFDQLDAGDRRARPRWAGAGEQIDAPGSCTGTFKTLEGTCTVTMSAAKELTATLE